MNANSSTEAGLKWVRINKYCELSGDTLEAIRARRRRRLWIEGVHWRKAGGVFWINPAEVEKWIESSANSQ